MMTNTRLVLCAITFGLDSLAETLHSDSEDLNLLRAVPRGYSVLSKPREFKGGTAPLAHRGGVTVIFNNSCMYK